MFGYSVEKILNGVFFAIVVATILFCIGVVIGIAVAVCLL